MKTALAAFVLAAVACSDPDPPPSCQRAVTHFYGAGCMFFDPMTMQPYPAAQITSECLALTSSLPDQCDEAFADFRSCLGGVPSPATSSAQCDCTQEQMALLSCE